LVKVQMGQQDQAQVVAVAAEEPKEAKDLDRLLLLAVVEEHTEVAEVAVVVP
jgi:hypothetical protein